MQAGQIQGAAGQGSDTIGYPPTPDYATYIYWNGQTIAMRDCNGNVANWYQFEFKAGSLGTRSS